VTYCPAGGLRPLESRRIKAPASECNRIARQPRSPCESLALEEICTAVPLLSVAPVNLSITHNSGPWRGSHHGEVLSRKNRLLFIADMST
jgi:hypothetical protein